MGWHSVARAIPKKCSATPKIYKLFPFEEKYKIDYKVTYTYRLNWSASIQLVMKLLKVEWPIVKWQLSGTEEILTDVAEDIKDRSVPQFLMKILLIRLFYYFFFNPILVITVDWTKTTDFTRFQKSNMSTSNSDWDDDIYNFGDALKLVLSNHNLY